MNRIDAEPLIEQLASVDASYEYLVQRIRAADGQAECLPAAQHRDLMDEIAKARHEYIAELVSLSFALRVQLEKPSLKQAAL